jgi:hypothetical protein
MVVRSLGRTERAEEGHIPIFESPSFVPDFITRPGSIGQ